MKGGYQIIDLINATAGNPVTIAGVYNTVKGNNGKPVMILTHDGQRVFSQVLEDDGDYLLTYLSGEGKTVKIKIEDTDAVTTTIEDDAASIEALTEGLNEINTRVDADTLGNEVNLYSYDGSTTEKIFTCPKDGYVLQNCGADADGVCVVDYILSNGNRLHLNCVYGSNGSQVVTFVKKGMQLIRGTVSTSSCEMKYRPLS